MPLHGYTRMFERMLNHPKIKVMLQTDFREVREKIRFNRLIYTGPVDEFFDWQLRQAALPLAPLRAPHRRPGAVPARGRGQLSADGGIHPHHRVQAPDRPDGTRRPASPTNTRRMRAIPTTPSRGRRTRRSTSAMRHLPRRAAMSGSSAASPPTATTTWTRWWARRWRPSSASRRPCRHGVSVHEAGGGVEPPDLTSPPAGTERPRRRLLCGQACEESRRAPCITTSRSSCTRFASTRRTRGSATCCSSSSAAPTASSPPRCSTRSRASTATMPDRKDLLMDIGTEELSHLEIVGTLARLHLAPMKFNREAAEADPLIAIAGGGGVNLFNSHGKRLDGGLSQDHRRARRRPPQQHRGRGPRQDRLRAADQFLRRCRHQGRAAVPHDARNHPHEGLRRSARKHGEAALLDRPHRAERRPRQPVLQRLRPAQAIMGEIDTRGPWNEGGDWEFVQSPAAPAQNGGGGNGDGEQPQQSADAALESSIPAEPDAIHESLVDHLRDMLHAEKQLVKALAEDGEGRPCGAAQGRLRAPSGGDRSPRRAPQRDSSNCSAKARRAPSPAAA